MASRERPNSTMILRSKDTVRIETAVPNPSR